MPTAVVTVAVLTLAVSAHLQAPTPGESAAAQDSLQTALLAEKPAWPFGFGYDGRPAHALLEGEAIHRPTRALDVSRRQHTLVWTDHATGLQIRCLAVECTDFPVVEWTAYLKNSDQDRTPILEDIRALLPCRSFVNG